MTNQQEITTAPTESRPTLDVAEAAALLGVSSWLVLQQIAKGNLPHKRFGRRIIIPPGGLPDLARARRRARVGRLPARGQAQRRAWESAADASGGGDAVEAGARGDRCGG